MDDLFYKYGRIRSIEIKQGFAFVQFDDERDAKDAVRALDGIHFMGDRIQVNSH